MLLNAEQNYAMFSTITFFLTNLALKCVAWEIECELFQITRDIVLEVVFLWQRLVALLIGSLVSICISRSLRRTCACSCQVQCKGNNILAFGGLKLAKMVSLLQISVSYSRNHLYGSIAKWKLLFLIRGLRRRNENVEITYRILMLMIPFARNIKWFIDIHFG